jgi:hypothetical protein
MQQLSHRSPRTGLQAVSRTILTVEAAANALLSTGCAELSLPQTTQLNFTVGT